MNDIKLKPCPFCGGEAALLTSLSECVVRCTRCGAETREVESHGGYLLKVAIEVVDLWNKRVGEQ